MNIFCNNYNKYYMGIFQSTPTWTIIDNQKYDMSELIKYHPGGSNIIKNILGLNCTEQFRAKHGHIYDHMLKKYKLH